MTILVVVKPDNKKSVAELLLNVTCLRQMIVYANLDGSARNDRIIRYETDVINNSEVAPEIELVLLVFSLKNRIRCFEVNVFQIEFVHSVSDLEAGGFR